jgi:folate-binding protein YgfZ
MYSKTLMKPKDLKQVALLIGADGHDLLSRITTLDLSRIPMGQRTFGLILNPMGKIRTSFWITPQSAANSILEFEDSFKSILDQFTFAETYELKPVETQAQPESTSEFERILSLQPKLGNEFHHDESTNPLEVNLRSAIHDQKGCYPGQEVIEKVISLGSPAKKLALVSSNQKPPLNAQPAPMLDIASEQAVGHLTSVAEHGDHWIGLAVLRKTHWGLGTLLKSGDQSWKVEKISP